MPPTRHRSRSIWQLPPEFVNEMAALGATRSFKARTIVIQEGDTGDTLFVVLAGRVRVYLSDSGGREVYLNEHGPGEHFGEMMLDGGLRSASVITLEPTRCAVLTRDQIETYLASRPEAANAMVRMLIGRVRSLTRTVGNLSLLDVYGRVARLLLDLAEPDSGRWVVPIRITQQEIAQRVGASREMVSRVLHDLKVGGHIEMADQHIVICHPGDIGGPAVNGR